MSLLPNITARDWQPALGRPGEVVTDLADIAQCIEIILTTPKGSDPLRPEFGSDLWRYIDYPIDQAVPHLVREAWDALTLWEPRIQLVRIEVRRGDSAAQIVLRVVWQLAGQQQATEVSL